MSTSLNNPSGLAFDQAGNLYFADADNHVIRMIDPNGIITTLVGNGKKGCIREGRPAVNVRLGTVP
jgi:NHL repeat.